MHPTLLGLQLYKPSVIVTYAALLGLPLGIILYGLNVYRLGSRVVGSLLLTTAGVTYLVMSLAALIQPSQVSLGSIFMLLPLYQLANWPYADALNRGARPANSWIPVIAVFLLLFVTTLFKVLVFEQPEV